jgi:protein-disulfide isomerase
MNVCRFILASLVICSMQAEDPTANPIAIVNGHAITARELQQAGGMSLSRLEDQLYAVKQQKLQELIAEQLLAEEARRRNISVDSLAQVEINAKVGAIPEEEIHKIYEANKNQLQKPEAEVRDQVEAYLRGQKLAGRRQEYLSVLQSQAKVTTYLERPAPFRAEVSTDGPVRGPAEALVTIVEFEDFQCPYCKRVQSTLDQVLARYNGKVKLVHRDFPLVSLHPKSHDAHEAARCAGEQGKFWEFRNLVYTGVGQALPEQFNDYAERLKLDSAAFRTCVAGGKYKAAVRKDEEEGARLGVEGTPAFFVNGRAFSGAQPEANFAQIIDEELSKREHDK